MKQFNTVKSLVWNDLDTRVSEGVNVSIFSSEFSDKYFQELVRNKSHLAPRPLKYGTVNRYLEKYLVERLKNVK